MTNVALEGSALLHFRSSMESVTYNNAGEKPIRLEPSPKNSAYGFSVSVSVTKGGCHLLLRVRAVYSTE